MPMPVPMLMRAFAHVFLAMAMPAFMRKPSAITWGSYRYRESWNRNYPIVIVMASLAIVIVNCYRDGPNCNR